MSLNLFFNDTCPKCRKPTMHGVIEAHPSRRDIALQNYQCAFCGPVKTKIISLAPRKPVQRSLAQKKAVDKIETRQAG
jgi:C4-type Zn-finger protein